MSDLTPRQQIVLFSVLLIVWAAWTLFAHWNGAHLDISALFMAGWLYGDGRMDEIYAAAPRILDAPDLPIWREVMTALGEPKRAITPYIYPPIWAALLAWPAHALAPMTFYHVAFAWHMAAMLAGAVLAYTAFPPDRRPHHLAWGLSAFAILFGTWPVVNAFLTNQPQITVNLFVLLAFWLLVRGREWGAGAALGLAAAIKVSPILFALIFIANRNWRALAAALAVSGGIALASILVTGWPLHEVFLERVGQINGFIVEAKVNYSPEALLYQAAQLWRGEPIGDGREALSYVFDEPLWITLVTKTAFLGFLAALYLSTRGIDARVRPLLQLFCLSTMTALFGPLSWSHYFVVPMLLMPALFLVMPERRAWGWIAAVLIGTSLFAFSVLHRFNHLFMMTALVPALLYLGMLTATLLAARRTTRESGFETA
ncbi:MAG: glycosyltransferase family 87 protein [Paracoccaceae bacterium]